MNIPKYFYFRIKVGLASITVEDASEVDVVEVVRCKDCIFGYLYYDVRNGEADSWVECKNPDGLNRDVSVDGYCCASIRRRNEDGEIY